MQSQAAVTKERLVVAFAVAFAERGYLAVNLNEVLGELGLTKGAFYFHFRSKDDVAREIVQRQYDLWESTQQAALASQAATLDTLVDTVRSVCRVYQTDPIARGGGRLSSERSIIQAELPRPFVGWIDAFSELLANGQARGDVAAGIDPRQHANLLVAFLYGALMVSGELSRRQDLMARIDALWEVLLPALTPPASVPRPAAPTASS
ncbi:TetR/AcrR family transcriptional regulator [Acidiferrimicrobium sp. IK]|uniref:ScbR family autoregulator-binding transcription factor n=1 Tax=Acidiferrimicrobium sp. IK TaxID=2871700 RepID=UPI0021CB43C6|nr:ScbR family autoregulator-binding transcription factor [Acidiferrimicrobium sp. IK]MCU4186834.1 TetR/AcrR family transcriptional regulator [Acidiferrimicrobium sp. IK]